MSVFEQTIDAINGLVWGPIMLTLLLGTGIFLTIGLRGMTIIRIPYAFKQLLKGRKVSGEGEISPFNALMTALSSTVGTGNIAGVATAIGIGGPGALFWMWCTALVGMATKYAEAVLAVNYRETDAAGKKVGGPMYYIKNGLGKRWKPLAFLFALFGALAGFGLANTVQSNTVSQVLFNNFQIPTVASGLVMALLVALVLLGGIQRIAQVAGKLSALNDGDLFGFYFAYLANELNRNSCSSSVHCGQCFQRHGGYWRLCWSYGDVSFAHGGFKRYLF
jgi:AGCS family alanine or glycine:cation symporter